MKCIQLSNGEILRAGQRFSCLYGSSSINIEDAILVEYGSRDDYFYLCTNNYRFDGGYSSYSFLTEYQFSWLMNTDEIIDLISQVKIITYEPKYNITF